MDGAKEWQEPVVKRPSFSTIRLVINEYQVWGEANLFGRALNLSRCHAGEVSNLFAADKQPSRPSAQRGLDVQHYFIFGVGVHHSLNLLFEQYLSLVLPFKAIVFLSTTGKQHYLTLGTPRRASGQH
ncbi:hypothetical protein [Candidatus Burkholderia verschuerenii]|uniref:hypothetical protein n=1 Tax=Candidatus Burkholderia verschuerenii TaxID=242163 RepID=UPI0012EED425|nr:hypothetical protein [Candidatus Burkholderia verschuerenii]